MLLTFNSPINKPSIEGKINVVLLRSSGWIISRFISVQKIKCPNGSKLVYDKNGYPKIECERKIKYVAIESYDISPSTKVILYILTLSIIVGFLVLLFMKNIIRF